MVRRAVYGVIMAGGKGTRFWPRSREKKPKHLLEIFGGKSLLRETFERIRPMVPAEKILVVTGRGQARDVCFQLPEISKGNILVEPVGRNTAPCIGLAALHVRRSDPEGIMLVLPSDHYIGDGKAFISALRTAGRVAAEQGGLVTVGVKPTGPETGYGYVEKGEKTAGRRNKNVFRAKSFREKPDVRTAKAFVRSGRFLWNSGIFAWKAAAVLEAVRLFLPELHGGLLEIDGALGSRREKNVVENVYRRIDPVSIDYGVMEKSRDVFIVEGDFKWSDAGSWDALWELLPGDEKGNVTSGEVVVHDAKKSFVYSPDKLVALLGVEDLIVVDAKDCLLICRRGLSQDVRKIVDDLEKRGMKHYL